MRVMKDALACRQTLPTLTEIINSSLLTVFLSDWKEAEVITLLKDGDHEVPNNNRPVLLFIACSKICERVVCNQLSDYLVQHKHLSKHFDSIEHNILLQELRLIGVSKTSIEWFKSYLSNCQFVCLAQRSESRTITHGVP